jgi:hypothetical protein
LVEPGGRPRRLPVTGRLGVGDAGAILSEANGDVNLKIEASLAQA